MCAISGVAVAQETATLFGTISDTTGSDLKHGTIHVKVYEKVYKYQTKRGSGKYEIEVPANVPLFVEFRVLNHYDHFESMILAPGERREVSPTMHLTPVDEVRVVASRIDLEPIKPPPAGRIPTVTGNFEDFMKSTFIGVSSANELSSTYNVRGGNYDENLIYVNDIEIYRPFLARSGQQEGLSFIHSDLIDNIQFSAGGFDAKYGDKLSSVLDIKYKTPTRTRASILASLMGVHTHFEGRTKNRRLTYLVGARYRNNSYVLNSLQTKGDYRPVFGDAQALLTWRQTPSFRIQFLGHYSSNTYRVVPENRETAFGVINDAKKFTVFFDGQEITQFRTMTGALSLIWDVRDHTRIKFITSAFRSLETESFDVQGQYWLDDLETDLGSEDFGETAFNRGVGTFLNHARNRLEATVANAYIKGETKVSDRHLLYYGAKYQREQFVDKLSEWQMIDSSGFSIPQGPSDQIVLAEVLKADLSISSNRYSAYVQDVFTKPTTKTVTFNDSTFESQSFWRVAGGVRAQYWDFNNQVVVSPRGKISFKPRWYYLRNDSIVRRDAELRFSTGVYYQPPLYRELRTFEGTINPEVLAQRSIHFVLGGHTTFDIWQRPFKLIGEAYYKHLDFINPYEIDNVRIRYHAENKATGYAYGLDFKLNGEFVPGVESWAKISYLRTEEDITNDFYYTYFNSDGDSILFGFTANDEPVDSVLKNPGYIPRPADQRITFGLFFQDQMPKWPEFKVQLNLVFGTALPYGPPDHDRYKDVLRTPWYRRVDIGFSRDLLGAKARKRLKPDSFWHNVQDMWVSVEVFNLLNINNTVSYTWIKDVNNLRHPIPNFLTGRRLNVKFVCKF